MSISPVLTLSISHCLIFPPYLTLPPPLPFLTPSATPCLSPSSTYLSLLQFACFTLTFPASLCLPHLPCLIQLHFHTSASLPYTATITLALPVSPSLVHFAWLPPPATVSGYL
ncbi:hypothetical protein Pmani_039729 [Petrolisthes manimaculis]|uniref:Uncharacterized protein n=1 Tax=Petrolisthes manimaculis TaxID=1843537 RepID=A0AAE1TL29_9EUCA|nr:hypothetical protein Pmani_039729 [Petrolisthes manimaculis]